LRHAWAPFVIPLGAWPPSELVAKVQLDDYSKASRGSDAGLARLHIGTVREAAWHKSWEPPWVLARLGRTSVVWRSNAS
jgi:hypothetical protein